MIGRTIGKYRIVGQLGRGGAGVVYKAVDETLHRDVAVKTLNPDLANTEVMSRFRAEATILARLNHPQIATIYELFRADGDLLMVMEFVRGESLDKLSERFGAISPERAAYVIDQILSALEHAHRGGVVHRDVKPANVMVTDEGAIKIMDFGIARVLGAEQKTVDFRLMGTPAYMSPEQVLGEEVDGRSDLYSVGVLFYRLLTGALPFSADTALGMLQRQIRDTPIPLCAHRGGLPDWCEAIVQKSLAKVQADRFQSAEEFREARVTRNRSTGDGGHREDVCGRGQGEPAARADRDRDARSLAPAARCRCCANDHRYPFASCCAKTRRQHDLGSGGRRCDARSDRCGAWLRHAASRRDRSGERADAGGCVAVDRRDAAADCAACRNGRDQDTCARGHTSG